MSDLVARIQDDMIKAMKNREELKLSVLRMLKSAVFMAQIEKGKDNPLTDEEVLVVIRRLVKQRAEAAEMYKDAGADDRADSELAEAALLDEYLPAQMSDEQISMIVAEVASSVGAAGPKDMGKVMGRVMAAVKGQADGNRVKACVQNYLASLS